MSVILVVIFIGCDIESYMLATSHFILGHVLVTSDSYVIYNLEIKWKSVLWHMFFYGSKIFLLLYFGLKLVFRGTLILGSIRLKNNISMDWVELSKAKVTWICE